MAPIHYKKYSFLSIILLLMVFIQISCKKEYLSKDQQKSLFANPNQTELNAIYTDWQQRDLTPKNYQLIQQAELGSGAFQLKIVSYKLGDITEYAILIIPKDTGTKLPVQIHVGGFGLDITDFTVNLAQGSSVSANGTILALPALRGQSLTVNFEGTLYKTPKSTGRHCDAFDGATDDVLSLLNLIALTEPIADVNRTGVRGGSRGGTVAMLAGIRDKRVSRSINVVGPTNMLELTESHQNDPTYQCQFLEGYKTGTTTLAEARAIILRSSPYYFAQYLPLTQLHLGNKDTFVPISQGADLQQKMKGLANESNLQFFAYKRGHTDMVTDNAEFNKRTGDFFAGL